ncbi:MAG: 6-phosphofructokinase, partial [Candidatus Sumerlaeaceae bacterium]|nr:6-phosphofructokinase [Candidatus Sumerlaeaceae bacterium]
MKTESVSPLQQARASYQPKTPLAFRSSQLRVLETEVVLPESDRDEIQGQFPNTFGKPLVEISEGDGNLNSSPLVVGVVLSGGPAAGGHNAIAGLYDALKKANPRSKLYGFTGGPKGVFTGKYKELNDATIDAHRNTGGFDMIGSGRDKIETAEQLAGCKKTMAELGASALVVIGGDDSNTNAAILAEYFQAEKVPVQVIGLPKTIDGDMRNEYIEASFGFDSAARTYAELVGNICRDARSARKYYHFVKLMGRSASHVPLEVALQVQPNYTIISEEVEARSISFSGIVEEIVDMVIKRSEAGKNYGVVLVPEGL